MYAQPLPAGVMQSYPPATNVVVINQVGPHSQGWKDPGCCTICWGVFLLIFAILGSISAISSFSIIANAKSAWDNCENTFDPSFCTPDRIAQAQTGLSILSSFTSSSLAQNLVNLLMTVAVVVFYCKKSTTPAARAWNYACWILIAISQSLVVMIFVAIAALISAGSAILSSVLHGYITSSGNDAKQAVDTALSILSVALWVTAAISAVPMIISSVVAHHNKARCSCSTHSTTDYVN
jgi:hypothetical protein